MTDSDKSTQRKTRYALIITILRYVWTWIPSILYLVLVIALIPLIQSLTPYIDGSAELENPMTNSQLTAILCLLAICYAIILLGNRVKFLK